MEPIEITRLLNEELGELSFSKPVTHVYNPLIYARVPHERYLSRYGRGKREIIFFGMNPGPWGMAQTGVPFGDVHFVRDWMGIEGEVGKPAEEHPARPVEGFACPRREVSGSRLWGWAEKRYGSAEAFFSRFFVANYCPLCFFDAAGTNLTPDKIAARERKPLLAACDRSLRRQAEYFEPRFVVGVGSFAEKRARAALEGLDVIIGRIPHPSPANPASRRDWSGQVEAALTALGIDL